MLKINAESYQKNAFKQKNWNYQIDKQKYLSNPVTETVKYLCFEKYANNVSFCFMCVFNKMEEYIFISCDTRVCSQGLAQASKHSATDLYHHCLPVTFDIKAELH